MRAARGARKRVRAGEGVFTFARSVQFSSVQFAHTHINCLSLYPTHPSPHSWGDWTTNDDFQTVLKYLINDQVERERDVSGSASPFRDIPAVPSHNPVFQITASCTAPPAHDLGLAPAPPNVCMDEEEDDDEEGVAEAVAAAEAGIDGVIEVVDDVAADNASPADPFPSPFSDLLQSLSPGPSVLGTPGPTPTPTPEPAAQGPVLSIPPEIFTQRLADTTARLETVLAGFERLDLGGLGSGGQGDAAERPIVLGGGDGTAASASSSRGPSRRPGDPTRFGRTHTVHSWRQALVQYKVGVVMSLTRFSCVEIWMEGGRGVGGWPSGTSFVHSVNHTPGAD